MALVVIILAAALLFVWLDIGTVFNPPYLLLLLNLTFIIGVFTAVAVLAARSFAQSGSWPVLWMGSASLLYALAALTGGLLSAVSDSNAAVTTHNTGVLLTGFLLLVAAFSAAKEIAPSSETRYKRLVTIGQIYFGGLIFMVFLAAVSIRGLMPPFFAAQGPTAFRQMVLGTGILFFVTSSAVFLDVYRKLRTGLLYWFSLGLLLEAVGLFGVLLINTVGTPLTWIGRIAQYLGGIYVFIAILTAINEARYRQVSLTEVMSSYFAPALGFRALFENIPDAVVVTDLDHNIITWSQGAEELYGWKADEVIGRKMSDILPTTLAGVTWEEVIKRLKDGNRWQGEVIRRRKDGSQLTVSLATSPIRNEQGQVVALLGVGRDITERKKAEEALHETTDYLNNLLDNANAPMIVWDTEYRVARFNHAFEILSGISANDIIGKPIDVLFPEDSRQESLEKIHRTITIGEKWVVVEIPIRKTDGAIRTVLWNSATIYTANGKTPVATIAQGQDITERNRAEKALARAAQDWERTFDSMPDLVAILDTDYHIVRTNKTMAERLGLTPEKCVGLTCFQCVHKLNVPHELCPHRLSMADGKEHIAELHEPNMGGDFIVSTTPLHDADGKLIGSVHVARDITQRKRAEEALSYLASYPRLNPNPIIELDLAGKAIYVSPAAQRLFPNIKAGGNVLGHPFLSSVVPLLQSPPTDKGEPLVFEVAVGDIWYHQTLVFTGDRARVYALDITERKKAEAELKQHRDHLEELVKERTRELSESEERFATAFQSSPAAQRLVDFETFQIVDVNDSFLRLTGYSLEEVIGRISTELGLFKEEPAAHLERRRILKEKGRFTDCPMTVLTKAGEERHCLMSSEVISLNDKLHSLSVLEDITELKRAEAVREAEHQDRLRAYEKLAQIGRLSGSIAHELRNPLAVIDSSLVLLKMKLKEPDNVVNTHLDRIKLAVDRSLTAIQTLLEQARIKEPLLTTHDLREVVAEIVDSCGVPAGVKVVKNFSDCAVWVGADKEQLRLAFENIVKNAVEAMNGRGTIRLEIRKSDKTGQVIFQDSGPGIAPEHIDRIFEPLFTTKPAGVGFGLPNARMIIGKHGGTIEVKSEAGKGAAFIVYLPLRGDGETSGQVTSGKNQV